MSPAHRPAHYHSTNGQYGPRDAPGQGARTSPFPSPPIVQSAPFVCPQPTVRPPARLGIVPVAVLLDVAAALAGLAAVLGAVYLAAVWYAVGRFARRAPGRPPSRPPVTILKPLHGEDPELYDNLASFCRQAYPTVQVVFGVRDPGDPAAAVARRLIGDLPGADLRLVVAPAVHGTNLKISNLINMMEHARHPVLVVADSDMRVLPDYLDQVVAELARPGVGLATCLYVGRPAGNLWSRLGAQFINHSFLPAVLVGALLRPWPGCFGATVALHRETLRQIGGFARFRDQLADDYRLGAAIVEAGFAVALGRTLVEDVLVEPDAGTLLRHELRWARTIRAIAPLDYAGSAITYPVPFAALAALLSGLATPGVAVFLGILAWRLIVVRRIDKAFALARLPLWLVPVRDVLSLGLLIVSFCGKKVAWRGRRYRLASDGSLISE
ncbi:MAG: bacteriohopanetetrol glucosamine biosynthesis glycosyltransferase HpnI [Proteobacteria bacterium]|nr:bacteriohopanetetrol glucosamine biosynthesis glycosyltransferase HpnI [Pseudomonadota bacterium]